MKLLKIIPILSFVLFVILVTNCNKQPLQKIEYRTVQVKRIPVPERFDSTNMQLRKPVSSSFHYTLARAYTDSSIRGVKSTFDVKNLGNESGRSAWVSTKIGDVWVQIGYRNNGIYVMEYYYGDLGELTIVNPSSTIFMGQKNSFFIRNILGTTYWEIGINEIVILKWNGHTTTCVNAETGIEFYGSNSRFPLLNFYPALEVYNYKGWAIPPRAYLTFRGKWGAEGIFQNNNLRFGELNMAGAVPSVSVERLW